MRKDIIAIIAPDVHGRDFWKLVVDKYDGSVPFIFLGDYMDPYPHEGITLEIAENNFKEIWEFKQKYHDSIILLLGNHDMSYKDKYYRCCRYSSNTAKWYCDFLNEHWEDFKFAHNIILNDKKYVLSHAGILKEWLLDHGFEEIFDADYINSLYQKNRLAFNSYSFYRGGYGNVGSPIWSDIREHVNLTDKDIEKNVFQIVGHTQLNTDKFEKNNITCIDSRQLFVLTKDGNIEPY